MRSNTSKSFPLKTANQGIWKDIWQAISGSQQDFTQGNLGRAILLLSIPMVLEMFMESVFAIVDIFFVSRLGANAVATVGITESMLTIVYAISIGLSMATTAMIARRIGEKNLQDASVAAVQAIIVGVIVSIPIAFIGLYFSTQLLILMGASEVIVASGKMYTTIMLSSNIIIMLIFIVNAIFRGAGDATTAMRVLWIANLINIFLDPCLIFGLGPFPKLGVTGAAVATSIGRGTAVLFQFWNLFKGKGRIRIKRENLILQTKVMYRLLRLSLGGIGQFLIATSSWIGLVRIIAVFGSASLAGYTIAVRIIIFSILPSWGMSNAAATLVGQNLGAKKPERAEKAVWLSAIVNMIFLSLIAVIFITSAEKIVSLFSNEMEIILIGSQCLRFISYGYLFYAFGMVIIQAFNGAGDTYTPTLINFCCFWLIEIPLAYLLALKLGLYEKGVFIAIITAESLVGVIGVILFRRGKWKTRKI